MCVLSVTIEKPIDDCLSLIGQKCNKLLKLDLDIYSPIPISDRLFYRFSEFKAIEKLKINVLQHIVLSGSVECFKHCKQLKVLDIENPKLREDFFANIDSFVPKLQSLKITTNESFSDSFINSFHSMKSIQKVILHGEVYIDWYFGKCLSDVMSGPEAKNAHRVNGNCGFITYYWCKGKCLVQKIIT